MALVLIINSNVGIFKLNDFDLIKGSEVENLDMDKREVLVS